MPNLMDTVNSRTQLIEPRKSLRTCMTDKELNINASRSSRFYLVRVPVRRLPLFSVNASADGGMIVVDVNHHRRKATHSGFVPKVAVVRGLKSLQAAKASPSGFCNVWVGEKALRNLHISAEDSISSNALQSKLQRLLGDKYKKSIKASAGGSYVPSPWIEEIFPSDGHVIFRYDGETYKQLFSIDKKTQELSLAGEAVKTVVKYVPQDIAAASLADFLYKDTYLDTTMNQETTLDRVNYGGMTLGRVSYTPQIVPDGTYYPEGSELARPELRTMLNVREALSIFLNVLKDGMRGKGPLQPSFSPVSVPNDKFYLNACREIEIVSREARRKVNPDDFIKWQHATLTKKGEHVKYGLSASAYAYVGDRGDISTWFLRSDTPEQIKKSIGNVMECNGIPDSKKQAIKLKLKAMQKKG